MENKYFNKNEIFQIIAKERILSLVISVAIAFSLIGGSYYFMNEFIMKYEKDKLSNAIKQIDRDKIYRGIINLEVEEIVDPNREIVEGVKDGFDEYEASNQVIQASNNSSSSSGNSKPNLSSSNEVGNFGNSSTVQSKPNNNVATIDNSSITGKNVRILEGQEFNPIKDLNLKATDINGKDISDKITIVKNDVDIYSPGQYIVKAVVTTNNKASKELILTVNVEPTNLMVNIKEFKAESEFINKGENILLNLNLHSSKQYVSALSINVNGVDYPVSKYDFRSKNQEYTVELPSTNEAGRIDFNLSSIRMSDNTVIEVNKKTNITVVKERPQVSNFSYDEIKENDSVKALIKMNLEDKDSALINGTAWFYLYDESKNVVLSRPFSANKEITINHIIKKNGTYTVKIMSDLLLDNKVLKNEELFVEAIEVKSVDKTSLTGQNIKVKLGEDFEPIRDLTIKATDIDGSDITENVIIEENEVDINIPGKYVVKVLVINSNGDEIREEFNVEVINSIIKRILEKVSVYNENENEEINNSKATNMYNQNYRSTSTTVSGEDNKIFKSDLIIEGTVLNGSGGAPTGKIEVELPTKATFSVDKNGNFTGSNFSIVNKSGCDINLLVANFIETKPKDGITIDNSITDFTSVGRATISLQLEATANGVTNGFYLDKTITNENLVTVGAGDSAAIHILGKAGSAPSSDEDTNGASEEFIIRFKIQKKK